MKIHSLRYYNFRNIENVEIKLNSGLHILYGNNGQGKTNFIEGLNLCLTGEIFRFGDNIDLVRFGQKQSAVILDIELAKNRNNLKVLVENGKKNHWLNEKKTSVGSLSSQFPVIIFSPESLNYVKEGSTERRDLIDHFLFLCPNINYQTIFNEFSKILKSKNKILKSYSSKNLSREQALALLESYEDRFIHLSSELTFHRIKGLNSILHDFKKAAQLLYSSSVEISVEYLISNSNALHHEMVKIEQLIRSRLYELRDAEMAVGHSLVGPHKHEINFLLNNRSSRIFCSQGQQRTLILAFKLAQMMYHTRVYGVVPILFLDDVLSELDNSVRVNLVNVLNETKGQIFITTTDKELCRDFRNQEISYINVKNGDFFLSK